MDHAGGVLVEDERLEHEAALGGGHLHVHQAEGVVLVAHLEGVGRLADLALERLPVERDEVVGALGLHFGGLPGLETLQVHEPHRAGALAGRDERVVVVLLIHPAEAAVVALLHLEVLGDDDFFEGHVHHSALAVDARDEEVLDAELHAAQLDDVVLRQLVVDLALRVLQRPHHQPDLVVPHHSVFLELLALHLVLLAPGCVVSLPALPLLFTDTRWSPSTESSRG